MGGDYTGEIGEGKGVSVGRGPGGTPGGCPRWTDWGKGLILLGKGVDGKGLLRGWLMG